MSGARRKSIKIINGALDETPQGDIVLRGVIDPDSLAAIKTDEYQREILNNAKIAALMKALRGDGVPDVELGMRGERFTENSGGVFLQDPVYVVDGLQRITAGLRLMSLPVSSVPHIGATTHFGTTEEWERERFDSLNVGQTRLSGNVTLRNQRSRFTVADALYRLSGKEGFALCNMVSWGQNKTKTELITAITYTKVTAMLHSHAGPGRGSNVMDVIKGVQKIMDNVGRGTFVSNVSTFFDILDRSFGIKRVHYRESAPYLRTTFLLELARVFSDHSNFWDGDKLTVDDTYVNNLRNFPIADPEVIRLASAGGMAGELLYGMFVRHFDSGRRTKRLVARRSLHDVPEDERSGYGDGNGDQD